MRYQPLDLISTLLSPAKNEEGATRDDFIKRMFGLNEEIRKLYESIALAFSQQDNFSQTTSHSGLKKSNEEEIELAKRDLENKLALDSQITMEEEEYKTMQNVHKQVVTAPL